MEKRTNKNTVRKATITVRLSNGMLVRIPFKNHKETLEKMEKKLSERKTEHSENE